MNPSTDFERLVESWLLADGPQDLPPQLVRTALQSARAVPQLHAVQANGPRLAPAGTARVRPGLSLATLLSSLLIVVIAGAGLWVGAAVIRTVALPVVASCGEPVCRIPALEGARASHTATLLLDGRILLVGGTVDPSGGDERLRSSVETWDPATGSLATLAALAEPRSGHTATLLHDGRVLIVGGTAPTHAKRASAELWDPASGTMSATGSLAAARNGHTATLLPDGRVVIIGGFSFDTALASAEIWDPGSGIFRPAGWLLEARGAHTSTQLPDGRILVVGGRVGTTDLASAELWDPAMGTSEPAGTMAVGRSHHTATLLPDGDVLVIGGAGAGATSAEIWDPTTKAFTSAESLSTGRSDLTATLLPGGRVLVVGGTVGADAAAAEVWDPTDGTFGPAGWWIEPRSRHTTSLLSDAWVLIVGGLGDDQAPAPPAYLVDLAASPGPVAHPSVLPP